MALSDKKNKSVGNCTDKKARLIYRCLFISIIIIFYFIHLCSGENAQDESAKESKLSALVGKKEIGGVSTSFANQFILPYLDSEKGIFSPSGDFTTLKFDLIKDIIPHKKELCSKYARCDWGELELLSSETHYKWIEGELSLKYTYKNVIASRVTLDKTYYPSRFIDTPKLVMLFTKLNLKNKKVLVTYPTPFLSELSKRDIAKYLSLFFNSSIRDLIDHSQRKEDINELKKHIVEVEA